MTTFIAANLSLAFFALIVGLLERTHRHASGVPHTPLGGTPPTTPTSSGRCTTSTSTAEPDPHNSILHVIRALQDAPGRARMT